MNEKQQKVATLKKIYNDNGIESFGSEFVRIVQKYSRNHQKTILNDLKKIHDFASTIFLIANCRSNCFDHLEGKIEIQCKCINDNIVISVKE